MATDDTVGDAIADYINESHEGAGMLTGYFVIAEFLDSEGDPCWMIKVPEGQNLSAALSLIEWARLDVRQQAKTYMHRIHEEEE